VVTNQSIAQTKLYKLKPSANLTTDDKCLNWLESSREVEKILNLTLSLIHPGQFQCGLKILRRLRCSDLTKDIALKWQSVFTGVSVVSNRITPLHRDRNGRPEWFDLLANYCTGEISPRFLVTELGLDLQYSSGTVLAFCGNILEHEVRDWGLGDRVCYAHFMREKVRKRFKADHGGWVNRSVYEKHIPNIDP
jgi:hypothetical protein